MAAAQVIDDRELRRRLAALGKAAPKVQRRARKEAAIQVRTQARRQAANTLNLYANDIKALIIIKTTTKYADFRVRYRRVPAHHFKGWKVRKRIAGTGLTEYGGRQGIGRRMTMVRAGRKFTSGLVVKFDKTKGPINFPKAFRQPSVGGGRVFIQRKGRKRYPTEAITGPSVHGVIREDLRALARVGRAAYRRRLTYWVEKEAGRL